jgi:hypothetical protein
MSAAPPRDPLSALLYLRRNPRRVLPAVATQALVTALVLAVLVPLTGWKAADEPYVAALRAYTAVSPMSRERIEGDLASVLDENPAMESRVPAKVLWVETPAIVGEMSWLFVALDEAHRDAFLARTGLSLAQGALPRPGTNEAALHEDVARARGLAIGAEFGREVSEDQATPGRYRVSGLLAGEARVSLFDLAFASRPGTVLERYPPIALVYAKPGRKGESDAWLHAAKDASGAPAFRVTDEAAFLRSAERHRENLPYLLDGIVGALTVVVGLVTVLFHLIAFQARADEFALLLAVGRSRGRLARKMAAESLLAGLVAWALGFAAGYAWLGFWRARFLEPRAIDVDFLDPYTIALASALPLLSAAAGAVAVVWRLRRLDPVAIVQRRNA